MEQSKQKRVVAAFRQWHVVSWVLFLPLIVVYVGASLLQLIVPLEKSGIGFVAEVLQSMPRLFFLVYVICFTIFACKRALYYRKIEPWRQRAALGDSIGRVQWPVVGTQDEAAPFVVEQKCSKKALAVIACVVMVPVLVANMTRLWVSGGMSLDTIGAEMVIAGVFACFLFGGMVIVYFTVRNRLEITEYGVKVQQGGRVRDIYWQEIALIAIVGEMLDKKGSYPCALELASARTRVVFVCCTEKGNFWQRCLNF